MLDLYRRQVITAAELERQLDKVADEQAALSERGAALRRRATDAQAEATALAEAGDLVARVQEAIDGGLNWATRRQLVELLVEGVTITQEGAARVLYRFSAPRLVAR
jgi:hypothetical protein